jgi:hypothetical protein
MGTLDSPASVPHVTFTSCGFSVCACCAAPRAPWPAAPLAACTKAGTPWLRAEPARATLNRFVAAERLTAPTLGAPWQGRFAVGLSYRCCCALIAERGEMV